MLDILPTPEATPVNQQELESAENTSPAWRFPTDASSVKKAYGLLLGGPRAFYVSGFLGSPKAYLGLQGFQEVF